MTRELTGIAADAIPFDAIVADNRPMVIRSLTNDWPLVRAGRSSDAAAITYLKQFDTGRPLVAYLGPPEIGGRFHYDESGTALNFSSLRAPLSQLLDQLAGYRGATNPPALYLGSTDLDTCLPGFRADNELALSPLISAHDPLASIWIGNQTIAAAHHDMSNNIACPLVGRRRFTLFPPDQIANLYPGPLAPTPAGQVVSMVDFAHPDPERYPRFEEALAASQTAELEPGDVLIYPALWWHHVEALDPFNVMVNYWWDAVPGFVDTPMTTLLHAILSLRNRPASEKQAWAALFDYYVFGPCDSAIRHLPPEAHGALGPLDPVAARQLRAELIQRLNR